MSNQYINIKESEIDIPIYRIFDLKRFEELIINSKLMLVRSELREDTFKNYHLQLGLTAKFLVYVFYLCRKNCSFV